MLGYVNHRAVEDVFVSTEAEHDPQTRAEMLASIQHDFIEAMLKQYERTAYELKKAGWNTGQISDLLDLSERRVKRMITDYSERTGEWNLLRRRSGAGAIDISHLVMRGHSDAAGQASPSGPSGISSDDSGTVGL